MSAPPARSSSVSCENLVDWRLDRLLAGIPHEVVRGDASTMVSGIATHSRHVRRGDVFVCLPGYRTEAGESYPDRHPFALEAVRRGAVAVIVERDVPEVEGVPVVRVRNAWQAVAELAARFYGDPSQDLVVVGVTGTSGKTSTCFFTDSILRKAGWRTARFGTVGHRIGEEELPARQTTPEAPELQALLSRARSAGCRGVVMEVSSHALELRRVASVAFDVAVFTNLGRDHLNFHPDMHHYLRAKGRLFEELSSGGKRATAVVNVDDPASTYICGVNRGELCTYGLAPHASVRAENVSTDLSGTRFLLASPWDSLPVHLPHPGIFHVHNALAAAAVGLVLGISLETIARGLASAPAVPGRFERVDCGQDFLVIVDYAHKPEALDKLIRSAQALGPRRILTVFGCGGDRDRGKRPLMGQVAAAGSDVVFVTSDNPRSEAPEAIVADIMAGIVPGQGKARIEVIVDRTSAIRAAIAEARTGDVVLIAGKGHEMYQIFADRTVPFDDREVARQALEERLQARPDEREPFSRAVERS